MFESEEIGAAKSASRRQLLRAATAPLHDALDGRAAKWDLRQSEDYVEFLLQHAAALAPLEALLEANDAEHILPDWPQRRRMADLQADLTALGQEIPPVELDVGAAHPSRLYGILYVLEGARLGAEVLVRIVASSPIAAVRDNCRYLSHGRRAGRHLWRDYLDRLEGADNLDMDAAISGAREAFERFLSAGLKNQTQLYGFALS